MNFINLTPHDIVIKTSGNDVTIPTSGIIARVTQKDTPYIKVNNNGHYITLYTSEYSDVQNLPDREIDTIYIVSSMVAQAVKDRVDVVYPGRPVRNEQGQIIATDGLCHA